MGYTNFDKLIPEGILFSIKEIDTMKLIKSDMMKKIIYNHEIEVIKVGHKNFISRTALISYLERNIVPAYANY